MDTIIQMMLIFWGALVLFAWLLRNGMGFVGDALAGMTGFMLGKALGPGATLLEGRSGSASSSWIHHGLVWLFVGASITFVDLWLGHSPNDLYSLQSWSWDITGDSAFVPSVFATFAGGIHMMLIGAALHIIPRLANHPLASEGNAGLMAMVTSLGVFTAIIGTQFGNNIGDLVAFGGNSLVALAALAIIANVLLTVREQEGRIEIPQWFFLFGMIGYFAAQIGFIVNGPDNASTTLWMMLMLQSGIYFGGAAFGLVYYAIPASTGQPLPSRSLIGLTLIGTILTVSPSGYDPALLGFADIALGPLDHGVTGGLSLATCGTDASCTGTLVLSTLMALSVPVAFMFAGNVLTAIRRSGALFEDTALTMIAFGALMTPIFAIASLFTTLDSISGSGELATAISSVRLGSLWGSYIPLILGGVLAILPDITGRELDSQKEGRRATYFLAVGSIGAFVFSLAADFANISFAEAMVLAETEIEGAVSSTASELMPISSVLFYGAVIGVLFITQNVIRSASTGAPAGTLEPRFDVLGPSDYVLAGPTTVRDLLTAGLTLDTMISPENSDEEDDNVGPTHLSEEE